MSKNPILHWTGNPFVDAGLAAIAAVTSKDLSKLTFKDLEYAAKELTRILLSDQALGIGVATNFATKSMGHLFFNSELHNPANWAKGKTMDEKVKYIRQKFSESIRQDLIRAKRCLASYGGNEICHTCGRRCPPDAIMYVRKDRVPLLSSIVNFYPAFSYGFHLCSLCALAIRFLPMSVMRIGKRFWFLHTQSFHISTTISLHYGWTHFKHLIARNEAIDFFGDWETINPESTVLYLLFDLLDNLYDQVHQIYRNPMPTTAYIFSNYGNSTFVHLVPIPNIILSFLAKLHLDSVSAYRTFWKDLLSIPRGMKAKLRKARQDFVQKIAHQILHLDTILRYCLDNENTKVSGGWIGHRLYLMEVMGMQKEKLVHLENIGLKIAQSEDAKKWTSQLQRAEGSELFAIFLQLIRRGWITHEQFYFLIPPNDYIAANEARDIILAVIYEWNHCQEQGRDFPSMGEPLTTPPADETLQRIQRIGEQILSKMPNPKRWIGMLQTAKSIPRIRGTYLNAIKTGAIGFLDFVFLSPIENPKQTWNFRDYLLAYLYDHARDMIPEEEESVTIENEEILS